MSQPWVIDTVKYIIDTLQECPCFSYERDGSAVSFYFVKYRLPTYQFDASVIEKIAQFTHLKFDSLIARCDDENIIVELVFRRKEAT